MTETTQETENPLLDGWRAENGEGAPYSWLDDRFDLRRHGGTTSRSVRWALSSLSSPVSLE